MVEVLAGARAEVNVPAPPPVGGGVLSVATVIDDPDTHALMGAMYLTDACGEMGDFWDEWCTMTPTGTKAFDAGPDVVEGDPFVIYAGVECDLVASEASLTRARNRFAYAERRLVDKAVVTWLEANATALDTVAHPVAQAIGWLEDNAVGLYGGQPTIIMPVAAAGCACGGTGPVMRDPLTGMLSTCNGSKVGTYSYSFQQGTGPAAPPATGASVYITGQITLLRGPLMTFVANPSLKSDGTITNDHRAIAERIYVPLIECFAAKIPATCA